MVLHHDRSRVLTSLTATDPRRLGPYEILGKLGAGGMGVVYLARDREDQRVALKVMNPEWAALPEFAARFQREAEAARRVARFCTAPVLDAAVENDTAYLVTEYVEGPTLWEKVGSAGPLRGAGLESVAVGVAVALNAIHAAGVVHRDLKPGNVILSPFGPKVIDFGIAKLAEASPLTGTIVVGTPAFMSPEQARGEQVGPASDIFSWGAVIAYAATGRFPFGQGNGPEVLYRVVNNEPDLSGLPDPLRGVVERALAKDPLERPTSRELIDRLAGRPATEVPTVPARRGRHGRVAAAALGVGAAAMLAATLVVVTRSGAAAPLFKDEFDTSRGWAYAQTPAGTTRQREGAYLVQANAGQGLVPTAPVDARRSGVSVGTHALLSGGPGGIGVWCRGSPAGRYDFYVDSAGTAAIGKQRAGGPAAGTDLARREVTGVDLRRPLEIEAECGDAPGPATGVRLRLLVNGHQVAEAVDRTRPYGPGAAGLVVYARADAPALGRFESFTVRELPR